jgi:hypothetical protein
MSSVRQQLAQLQTFGACRAGLKQRFCGGIQITHAQHLVQYCHGGGEILQRLGLLGMCHVRLLSKNQTIGECGNDLIMYKKTGIFQVVITFQIESKRARASIRSPLCTKAVRLDRSSRNGVTDG